MRSRARHYTRAMRVPKKAAERVSGKPVKKSASTEVEVKLTVHDRQAVSRALKRLKATAGPRMHEMNTLYDTPTGALAGEGRLVRIRVLHAVTPRKTDKSSRMVPVGAVLTYKGPVRGDGAARLGLGARYKIREEHELRVEDGEALARVFQGMGLQPSFRYEKYRTTFRLSRVQGVVVELDETPIGDFLELEGDPTAIDRAAAALGYSRADYITKSYGELFIEHLRRSQRRDTASFDLSLAARTADMLFPRQE